MLLRHVAGLGFGSAVIVELDGSAGVADEAKIGGAQGGGFSVVGDGGSGVGGLFGKVLPIKEIGGGQVGERAEGRVDVEGLDDFRTAFAVGQAGSAKQQRGAQRFLEERVLAPHGVLAEVPTVVAPQEDDGVVGQAELFQAIQHESDLSIGIGNAGGVVAAEGSGEVGVLSWVAIPAMISHKFAGAVPSGLAGGLVGMGDGWEIGIGVEVEILLRRAEGEVRADPADGEKERLVGGVEGLELIERGGGDEAIGVDLVAALLGLIDIHFPGVGADLAVREAVHDAARVLPRTGRLQVPVPCAGKLGLCRVVPIGAATASGVMAHFSDRHGGVAVVAEMPWQGGSRGRVRELACAAEEGVVAATASVVGAGEQGVARGAAGGGLHVVALEKQAAPGEPVDIRRLDMLRAVAAQLRAEIVDAQQQHVGSAGGGEDEGEKQEKEAHEPLHTAGSAGLFRRHGVDSMEEPEYRAAMFRVFVCLLGLALALGAVPLRVATFNIETHRNASGWPDYALDEPGAVDFESVRAILARIDADVVALQEVHTSDINEGDLAALGTALGLPHQFSGVNSGNFDTSLRVSFLSRYPFLLTESIVSPPGAKELTRHSPAVVVDVPGTPNDPLLISAHLKAGTGSDDRFRRAIEMRRLSDYLAASGFTAADNFIVLGDFNPSGNNTSFVAEPSGLPGTFVLGGDVSFPVSYSTNMVSYFSSPVPTRLDPRQVNGDDGTYIFGQTLDLLMVSPALAGRPFASEIYNSSLDMPGLGLPKAGVPPDPSISGIASDHYAVFADFQLDQDPFNLALAASAPSVAEGDPDGTVMLTVTLAEPAASPVSITLVSDDAAAVPEESVLTIEAGGSTALATSRNFLFDGTRTVSFSAMATGYAEATTSVLLLDSDSGYVFTQPGEVIVEGFDGFGGGHDPAPWASDATVWLGLDDGTSVDAGARSYGTAGEDAPGFLGNGGDWVMETAYTNSSGTLLSILDIGYQAEQWRAASGGAEDAIEVELEVGGQVIPLPELDFVARTDLPDGPVAGGMPVSLATRVGGLAIAPGSSFTLRFRYLAGEGAAPLSDAVFINEFHYDNSSTDVGEFVEVVVGDGFPGEIADLDLVLYNGSNPGAAVVDDTYNLGIDFGPPVDAGDFRIVSIELPSNGIQNGGNDGFALVNSATSEVLQLISYEGVFTASEGPAAGMTSVDIGVSETNSDAVGGSLGLVGSGSDVGDFTWSKFSTHTRGAANAGQALVSPGVPSQGLAIDAVSVGFVEDTDGDGVGDDVDADDDNDGQSDDDELAFGTDPADAASIFRVSAGVSEGTRQLRFPGAEGVIYTIQWCDDLVSWNQSATVEGAGAEVVFALPAGGPRLFARVAVLE